MIIHQKLKNNRFLNYKTLVSFLISFLGIYLGFKDFDFHEFKEAILEVNLVYFIVSMLIMIFLVYLRAYRWKYLIAPVKKVSIFQLYRMEMVGYFGNNVFPLKLGEMLRAYSLGKQENISGISVFGTIINERLLDTVVVLVFTAVSTLIFPQFPDWVRKAGLLGFILLFCLGIISLFLYFNRNSIKEKWTNLSQKYANRRTIKFLHKLFDGLATLFTIPNISMVYILSFLIWGITVLLFWVIGMSMNISFTLYEMLLIFIVTSIVVSVPSAPGYIGTYHASAITVLVFLGVAATKAQVLAIIMHAVGFVPLTLIGLYYFLKFQIKISETRQMEK